MTVNAADTVWGHEPSVAGNAVFVVLFTLLTISHFYMRFRHGSAANFCNSLLAGGVFEVIGYIARAFAPTNLESVGPYAIQSLFLLLAPVLFAATCYMTLGRTIFAVDGQHLSRIPLPWLTKTFVICDIICFAVQATGGSLQALKSANMLDIGKWVAVVGLILQLVAFVAYSCLAVDFHRRLHRAPTHASREPAIAWRKVVLVIYLSSFLVILRNVVRVIEYAQGFKGWIITHEFMLFIFDGAPMAILLIAFLWWHPAKLLKGSLDGYRGLKAGSDITMDHV